MTARYDCADPSARAEGLARAARAVRSGGLVVLPTDTVYGVGADAFSAEAVAALLAAKGRGRAAPPPVLVPEPRTLDGLATGVPAAARALAERFWPGPLTLVVPAQPTLQWDLGDTGGTVAVRVPDDEVARELLTRTGPMAVSSANRTGRPAATTAEEAAAALGDAVEVLLDGGRRPEGALPSTIVDATVEPLRVLRAGALDVAVLREVVPGIDLAGADGAAGSGEPAA